jgi:hypothetical protein
MTCRMPLTSSHPGFRALQHVVQRIKPLSEVSCGSCRPFFATPCGPECLPSPTPDEDFEPTSCVKTITCGADTSRVRTQALPLRSFLRPIHSGALLLVVGAMLRPHHTSQLSFLHRIITNTFRASPFRWDLASSKVDTMHS